MKIQELINHMSVNAVTIEKFVTTLTPGQLNWKPLPEKWSIHQVIYHMFDEEQGDFKKRIEYTLQRPGEKWPAFDPEGNVAKFDIDHAEFQDTLTHFLDERARSLLWLNDLDNPDWHAVYDHPTVGPLRAGDLLSSWLVHDLMHIRQITNLQLAFWQQAVTPFDTKYASP